MSFGPSHVLDIQSLTQQDVLQVLDAAEAFFEVSRAAGAKNANPTREDSDQPLL